LAKQLVATHDRTREWIDAYTTYAIKSLEETGEATLPGLGKLTLVTKRARKGTSPRGKNYEVPARKAVKFRACKALKTLIAG